MQLKLWEYNFQKLFERNGIYFNIVLLKQEKSLSFILVAIGGALGSVFRYSIGILFSSFSLTTFPWGTLFVNITGSFLMGIVFFISKDFLSEEFKLFLSVGLLGGYTTFSAFSLDVINMLFNRDYLLSILYILSSVFISILFLLAGFLFIKFLNS